MDTHPLFLSEILGARSRGNGGVGTENHRYEFKFPETKKNPNLIEKYLKYLERAIDIIER